MSTLHHLEMAALDVRDRLTKEMQFSADSERQIDAAYETVCEAQAHYHSLVKSAFLERRRAIAAAMGSPGPMPETIEQHNEAVDAPSRKPKLVKAATGDET